MVLAAQQTDSGGVLFGVPFEQFRPAPDHNESQHAPVFGVSVGGKRDPRVFEYVPHPFETGWRDILGLFVKGYVDRTGRISEADRDDVRLSRRVGGRKPGHPLADQERCFLGVQDLGRGAHLLNIVLLVGAI